MRERFFYDVINKKKSSVIQRSVRQNSNVDIVIYRKMETWRILKSYVCTHERKI